MNEYDAEYEAMNIASETSFLERTLHFIKSGKNISPKDIANALRCNSVPIPKEILHYAAGLLDGSPKRIGKPIDVTLESARESFSKINFLAEEIRAKYAAMRKNGVQQLEIFPILAQEYGQSVSWISKIMYPRRKK